MQRMIGAGPACGDDAAAAPGGGEAAADLEASVEDLELVDGQVRVRGVPGRARTLAEICRLSGSFGAKYEPVFGRGQAAITDRSPGFAAHLARVRVDPDTGRVIPLRYVAVQDVGRAINPATVEGQMLGGAAQGAGWALYEQLAFDESGAPTTGSFIGYVLPRATQVPPEIEPVIVEVPSAVGPYGAKGVGEPPVIPSPAAFANAVRDATGVRLTHLPMTPERVFAALAAASGTG